MVLATARMSPPATGQLELRGTSNRLLALLRERQKLLTNVTRKKGKLDKLMAVLDAQHAQMAQLSRAVQPLLAQGQALDREVHGLFAAILASPTLKRKDRRRIQDLYDLLQLEGILTPSPSPDDDISEFDDGFGQPSSDFQSGELPSSPNPAGDSPSARRSSGATASVMRDLFRRLATAIHPDKAQDADAREQRTEAMKEVTCAYQDGDLARLIELEKVWLAGAAPGPGNDEDETERRCSSLKQTNRELKRQLKALDAKLRELKRSASAELATALGLAGRHGEDALGGLLSTLENEVEALRETRAFVQSFVDSKITCAQFVAGLANGQPKDPDDETELGNLDDFLADILLPLGFGAPGSRPPRRRHRRRR
jgi:cell division septum initiation protein DivIVA